MIASNLKLCFIAQPDHPSLNHCLEFIRLAVEGGVTSIQLRDKTALASTFRATALAVKSLLTALQIPLIINDDVALAHEIDAEGVHLGQSDCSPVEARRILGPDKFIGWSIECMADLQKANQLDCIDYIGAGTVFPTRSKQNRKTIWGLEGLKQVTLLSRHPVVAIGGINAGNVRDVMGQGASGVAVISAVREHSNPFTAAEELIKEIHHV